MTITTIEPPVLSVPETKEEANNSLLEIESAETSYNSICNQALQAIEPFLSDPELDPVIREKLRVLLPKIAQQKDKLMALISQAQDTLDTDDDDGDMAPELIVEYEQTINEFTLITGELNQQLELLSKVMKQSPR